VCNTYRVPLSHGPARALPAGGRLTGRWRYNGMAGRGIALSYDSSRTLSTPARRLDVHGRGRLNGHWRYNAASGRGIAVTYDPVVSEPSGATPKLPDPVSPPQPRAVPPPRTAPPRPAPPRPRAGPPTYSPGGVRVLCSCGDVFTFDGEAAACPTCGRTAAWPTMGVVEREMRSDLEELLDAHKQGRDSH
jgi:hypothetical protein